MKLKFCGVCHPEDAHAAVAAGADYVGVILSPGFPRSQLLSHAARIYAAVHGARRVGVFVNAGIEEIAEAARKLQLDFRSRSGCGP